MTKWKILAQVVACLLVAIPAARAQVQIEVSKITCEQYLLFKVADPRDIAIWLSGYYHGKKGSTVLETQALKDNADKLSSYCRGHPRDTVMQAVESLPGVAK
jgi:acid stress chaperone HdeB